MAGERIKIGGVEIDVRADGSLLLADLKRAEAQAKAFGDNAANEISRGLSRGLAGLRGALAGLLSGLGVARLAQEAVQAGDAFTGMRSRLSLVVAENENLLAIEEKLAQQALKNRADLNATVSLYTRLRTARKDLSDETTTQILDAWSKTLVISGANAAEAASSTLQFAQAMGSGVLQGTELTAVLENNSRAARLIADGLGVPIGQLKKVASEGKITTEELVRIFTKAEALDGEFAKMSMTVGQAGTNFNTAFTRVVGLLDQSTGLTATLAGWINELANSMIDLGVSLGGPIAQAEASLNKVATAQNQIIEDGAKLKTLYENLETAMTKQGEAAQVTARMEIDAVLQRIKSNKELITVYQAQAKAQMAAAQGELEALRGRANTPFLENTDPRGLDFALANTRLSEGGNTLRKQFGTEATIKRNSASVMNEIGGRENLLKLAYEQIDRDIEAGRPLDIYQRMINEFRLKATDIEVRLNAAKAMSDALSTAISDGTKYTPPGSGGGTAPIAPTAETEKKSKLQLYTTALQDYKKVIDEITKAEDSRADKSSAGLKAILDFNAAHNPDEALNDYNAALRAIEAQELSDADRHAAETKAFYDYQDALTAVGASMQLIADLSARGILSDEDAARARDMIAAVDFKDNPPDLPIDDYEIDTSMQEEWDQAAKNVGIDPDAKPKPMPKSYWEEYERDIMDATKRGLFDAVQAGEYGDLLGNIIGDAASDGLARAVNQLVDNLFTLLSKFDWSMIFGGADGGLGSSLNSIFDIFDGSRAGGGNVRGGRAYRVGELGAELFVPKTDGYIIPNTQPNQASGSNIRSITIGGATVNIDSMGKGVTPEQLQAILEEQNRTLGDAIDARVSEGVRRGTF